MSQEVATTVAAILADVEELQSRGFAHPDGQQIVGRIKVSLQQVNDLAGTPPPEPEPVDVALARLTASVESLHMTVMAAQDGKP